MPRRRRFAVQVGDETIVFSLKEMRWIRDKLRAREIHEDLPPGNSDALAVLIEEELENRNPRPILPRQGEVEELYSFTKFWSDAYPRWENLLRLRTALAKDRRRRGLAD